jgi:hypothetical protein
MAKRTTLNIREFRRIRVNLVIRDDRVIMRSNRGFLGSQCFVNDFLLVERRLLRSHKVFMTNGVFRHNRSLDRSGSLRSFGGKQ